MTHEELEAYVLVLGQRLGIAPAQAPAAKAAMELFVLEHRRMGGQTLTPDESSVLDAHLVERQAAADAVAAATAKRKGRG